MLVRPQPKRTLRTPPRTTGIAAERYDSIPELLSDAFIQFKSETALIEINRKRETHQLSYLQLKHLVDAAALRLQDAGVGADDRVAIVMSNQSKWLVAASAAYLRGAIVVPIDYKLKAKEQATLLTHAAPKVVVTEYPEFRKFGSHYSGDAQVWVSEVPEKDTILKESHSAHAWDPFADVQAFKGRKPDKVSRTRSDIATLVYSSGTSGDPKGCLLTHANYLAQFQSLTEQYPLNIGDKYFSILPTNHAIDFMCGFIGPLSGGATVVHQRSLRPEFITDTMKRYGITHMSVVPLILEAFERKIRENLDEKSETANRIFDALKAMNASATLRRPLPGLSRRILKPIHDGFGGKLRMLFCGGAFVPPERAQFFYDIGIPVVIGYGLTEACTVLTVNDLHPFSPDTVGRPLEGVSLEIRESDASGVGQVWVKSPTVFAGYVDRPDLTKEVLVDGWLKTGDLGYLDPAGHLRLVGRSKNMIVTEGGKNIYPEDVETAFESIDCEELVVFANHFVFDAGLTEEQLIIALRAKPESTREHLVDALTKLNRRLPEHKRVGAVLFTEIEFPRTASMKVKRAVLASELALEHKASDALELSDD